VRRSRHRRSTATNSRRAPSVRRSRSCSAARWAAAVHHLDARSRRLFGRRVDLSRRFGDRRWRRDHRGHNRPGGWPGPDHERARDPGEVLEAVIPGSLTVSMVELIDFGGYARR
jgi:hypothetical protein